jgi:hypothetical protein
MHGKDEELTRLIAEEATQRLRYQRLTGGRQLNGLTAPPVQDGQVIRAAEAFWREAAGRLRTYQVGQ